ncbi:hypothetical protein V2H45_18425 [Tumidithrix elongata RA019]|uniref:Uncharacterized protein n=1 Tax=Tumidithrix elongata BACA0141 TaxID=2716417 RepID=A0AAW9PW82_9CYAN|nr:hypothetical protein [Tumidithrix elongata RA019]
MSPLRGSGYEHSGSGAIANNQPQRCDRMAENCLGKSGDGTRSRCD